MTLPVPEGRRHGKAEEEPEARDGARAGQENKDLGVRGCLHPRFSINSEMEDSWLHSM